ncbi:MAG: hypothetical protein V2A58_16545 [Planctomycetota bacterium]
MYRKTLLILIVVLSLGILVIGFKIDKELAEMTRLGTASYVTPDEEVGGSGEGRAMEGVPAGGVREFRFTDLDAKTNLIVYRVSGRNAYPHRDGTIEIVRPRIVFYSSKPENEEVLRVSADRGIYHPRRRKGPKERENAEAKGTLRGNVVLELAQGVRAHLPSADWSEKTRKVTSPGEVVIESPDFRVYGEELEAVASAENDEVLIRRNVCVIFDKAEGTTLERIFAGEKREETASATGVVITCDGVMSYSAKRKNVTFEEKVLVTQTGGGFSPRADGGGPEAMAGGGGRGREGGAGHEGREGAGALRGGVARDRFRGGGRGEQTDDPQGLHGYGGFLAYPGAGESAGTEDRAPGGQGDLSRRGKAMACRGDQPRGGGVPTRGDDRGGEAHHPLGEARSAEDSDGRLDGEAFRQRSAAGRGEHPVEEAFPLERGGGKGCLRGCGGGIGRDG